MSPLSRNFFKFFTSFTLALGTIQGANAASDSGSEFPTISNGLQKPPQFVMFAFDGSKSIEMWKETRQYADASTKRGKPLKFTYFINTSYLIHAPKRKDHIPKWNRAIYEAPQLGAGYSAIGYSCPNDPTSQCTEQEVAIRANQVSRAFLEGHEIASHAVGHFDANGGKAGGRTYTKWTLNDWRSEHKQFFDLLFGALSVQNITPLSHGPTGMAFTRGHITGFRAPQLGMGSDFDQSLRDQNFQYDTTRVNEAKYWPEKMVSSKAWNMPLSIIPVYRTVGSKLEQVGKTLSMDYNFCVFQTQYVLKKSTGECNTYPELTGQFKDEMYQSYMQYFFKSYTGNRAPLQIGHHFSKWNNSAYWDAMKMFAESVCGLPDVKCVTYQEYVKWLNGLTSTNLAAYRNFKGNWSKKPEKFANLKLNREKNVPVSLALENGVIIPFSNPGSKNQGFSTEIYLNGIKVSNARIKLSDALKKANAKDSQSTIVNVKLRDKSGNLVGYTNQELKDIGLSTERIEKNQVESFLIKGDLPAAHAEK